MQIIFNSKLNLLKLSGLCGMLLPIIFILFFGTALFLSPWFDWTEYAISDLGVEGVSAIIFNTGIILVGIFAFIFSFGLIQILSKKVGAYIFMFSTLNLIGIGLFPIPAGILHFCVSITFFTTAIISLLLIGITVKKDNIEKKMSKLAIIFSFLGIFAIPFLFLFKGIAIPELIVIIPMLMWCFVYGANMILSHKIRYIPKTPAITG